MQSIGATLPANGSQELQYIILWNFETNSYNWLKLIATLQILNPIWEKQIEPSVFIINQLLKEGFCGKDIPQNISFPIPFVLYNQQININDFDNNSCLLIHPSYISSSNYTQIRFCSLRKYVLPYENNEKYILDNEIPSIVEFNKDLNIFSINQQFSIFPIIYSKIDLGIEIQKQILKENEKVVEFFDVKISNINLERINKIAVLFDYKQIFIGDTFLHLSKLKGEQINFPNTNFELITSNENLYKLMSELLRNTDYFANIILKDWSNVNWLEYDLILTKEAIQWSFFIFCCENLIKYINFPPVVVLNDGKYCEKIEKTCYCFPCKENLMELFPPIKEIQRYNQLTKRIINVVDEEINHLNEYLSQKGLTKSDGLIILPYYSSHTLKMLKEEVYIQLVDYFASFEDVKVLCFYEKNSNLNISITQKIEKIIFIEQTNIRMSIQLLAHSQVQAIIGPCTGIMHLVHGIIQFKIDTNQLTENSLPFMLVYAGVNQDVNYNPWGWWNDSYLSCALAMKQENNLIKLVPIQDVSNDIELFQAQSVSVNELTFEHILAYIEPN